MEGLRQITKEERQRQVVRSSSHRVSLNKENNKGDRGRVEQQQGLSEIRDR
jgi:hypothetical protein